MESDLHDEVVWQWHKHKNYGSGLKKRD